MSKPICVHCGKSYGQRWTSCETVRWPVATKEIDLEIRNPTGGTSRHRILDGEPAPPPAYRGNRIVVRESTPFLTDGSQMTMERYTWDGESYYGGYNPFCTLRCALDYARKAYAKTKATIRRVV